MKGFENCWFLETHDTNEVRKENCHTLPEFILVSTA